MGRWLIQLFHDDHPHYHGGERSGPGSIWVFRREFATKFNSPEEAETFALLLSVKEPEVLAKLAVVNYDDAKDGAPPMDDRQARR